MRSKQIGLLHYSDELLLVDLPVAVPVGLVYHLLQLFLGHCLPQLPRHPLQVLQRYLPGPVVVEQSEGLEDLLPGVSFCDFTSHKFHKISELDDSLALPVDLSDHLFDFLLLGLEAEGSHGNLEFLGVDVS